MVLLLLLSSLLKALTLKFSNRVDMKGQIYVITFLDGSQIGFSGMDHNYMTHHLRLLK